MKKFISQEQIQQNKERFIELIKSIKTEGADIEGLLRWLDKSDFFKAPSSTKYHCAYEGGLCEHSLNVYDSLIKLVPQFGVEYPEDSLKVVALLHDIAKANFYESYQRNVKDETGKWIQVEEYKVREPEDRFIYGNHEQNSEFMIHTFFPLSVEESTSILHHHAGMSWDSAKDELSVVYNKYPLAVLLHMADLAACYITETR